MKKAQGDVERDETATTQTEGGTASSSQDTDEALAASADIMEATVGLWRREWRSKSELATSVTERDETLAATADITKGNVGLRRREWRSTQR